MTESLSTPPSAAPHVQASPGSGRWMGLVALLLAAVSAGAVYLAWNTQQRVKELEQQLVKRQQESGVVATEAQVLAKQAQETSRDAAAKMALLEARVAEATLQRSQLEDLIQSLSRARDENVLADVEASIRVALQQTAITGSVQPLVVALKQAEERVARQDQPRLEGVRRALVQDLDRVRVAGAVDVASLAIRLDEAVRLVDDLPLLSAPERPGAVRQATREVSAPAVAPAAASASATEAASAPRSPASAAAVVARPAASSAPASAAGGAGAGVEPSASPSWQETLRHGWTAVSSRVWDEVRGLIRITPVDAPEAMLIAPDQAFFLRQNLKLRLLNARLALLSRQFDTAQADLRDALAALERYFDRSSKRVQSTIELVRRVSSQTRQVVVPRPDATLAAIAAAAGGR